jgi:hypothetical protein
MKRQSKFIEDIKRKGRMELAVTTGKIVGKRDRGRQREKILDSLTNRMGMRSNTDLITNIRDRNMLR